MTYAFTHMGNFLLLLGLDLLAGIWASRLGFEGKGTEEEKEEKEKIPHMCESIGH